jgi:hypothetical protein
MYLTIALRVATIPLRDPDIWWVAAAGREMLRTRELIRTNFFSFTAPNEPWVMHEWALGIPYAMMLRWLGAPVFHLLALLLLFGSITLVVLRVEQETRSKAVAALIAIVLLATTPGRVASPRPMGIALLCAVAMAFLAFSKRFGRAHALIAVGLELFWTNSHGSFPLGVFLLLGGAFCENADRPRRLMAGIAAGLVTLLNPHGIALHVFVLKHVLGDHGGSIDFVRENITEFRPIWRDVEGIVGAPEWFLLLLSVFMTVSALFKGGWYTRRGLLCVPIVLHGILQIRQLEQGGILAIMLLSPVLQPPSPERTAGTSRMLVTTTGTTAIAALVFAWFVHTRSSIEWIAEGLGGPPFVRLAKALPHGARVFTPFTSGGLMIWLEGTRGVRVFFDPRNDCYPPSVGAAILALDSEKVDPRSARLLERYGVTHILATESNGLVPAALATGRYRPQARDGDFWLLEKTAR